MDYRKSIDVLYQQEKGCGYQCIQNLEGWGGYLIQFGQQRMDLLHYNLIDDLQQINFKQDFLTLFVQDIIQGDYELFLYLKEIKLQQIFISIGFFVFI
ncbi:unnamed protein product [Paramecium pentaurelia]|uniref:Uncharacterized protein n=1 Tax=Paramecium pentaurelia TaxID=43138 RepID=A0A8S1W2Z0_9CILI|nr:unnamed protein product [Paramecium pentaurelia]